MLIAAIVVILAFGSVVCSSITDNPKYIAYGGSIFIIWALTVPFVEGVLPRDEIPVVTKIVSMRDNNSINGHFFLGTGTIGTEMVYSFYIKTKNGYQHKFIPASDRVTIKYSDNARLVEYYSVSKHTLLSITDAVLLETIIYIPTGSIKNEYVLDNE